MGTIELKIPKVTRGSYFPSVLEPRRRAERALHAVVVEAYVKGVSTRMVDDLVKTLGIDGISRIIRAEFTELFDALFLATESHKAPIGGPARDQTPRDLPDISPPMSWAL